MKSHMSIAVCACCLALATLVAAGESIPVSAAEIPLYPGAARDADAESALAFEGNRPPGPGEGPQCRDFDSGSLRAYSVNAAPEEVFAFYLAMLGGTAANDGKVSLTALKTNGDTTPVTFEVWYHDFSDAFDDGGRLVKTGADKKASLAAVRKPDAQGCWIRQARFCWYALARDGFLTEMTVEIADKGLADDWRACAPRSSIIVAANTYKPLPRADEAQAAPSGAEDLTTYLTTHPPTDRELGVPVYPGAQFEPKISAGMSVGGKTWYYIFLTNDAPAKVAAFYEKATGREAVSAGNDMYLITLRGELPSPAEAISVQPNAGQIAGAKTIITIQRQA